MKKTIIILSGAIVAISILWLVDEKLPTKTSKSKFAESQKKNESVQQISTTEEKAKAKPTSKPPVYDLSPKKNTLMRPPKQSPISTEEQGYSSKCWNPFIQPLRNFSISLNTKPRSENSGNPFPKTNSTLLNEERDSSMKSTN